MAKGFSKPGWNINRAYACWFVLWQVNVRDPQGAAPLWPVLQNMPKFRAMEGHGQIGRCRRSKDLAAVGTKTARGVHRDDLCVTKICGFSDQIKRPCSFPVHRARQARSKHRVNKQKRTHRWTPVCVPEIHIGERAQGKVAHLPYRRPTLIIRPRIGGQPFRVPIQEHFHLPAPLFQTARHDETVTAIVARAAEDHSAVGGGAQLGPFLKSRLNHAPPGAFHQFQSGDFAAVNRRLFKGPHLRGGEEFGHFSGTFSHSA